MGSMVPAPGMALPTRHGVFQGFDELGEFVAPPVGHEDIHSFLRAELGIGTSNESRRAAIERSGCRAMALGGWPLVTRGLVRHKNSATFSFEFPLHQALNHQDGVGS